MAEGLCHAFKSDIYTAYSAGIKRHGLNPRAVEVMTEIGIDISQNQSKTLDDLQPIKFDEVITVCANADKTCPRFSGDTRITHIAFDDPPKLAEEAQSEEEALKHFRRVRDEIKTFINSLPDRLEVAGSTRV